MKLIADWKSAYKKFSVQALLVIGVMQSLSALFPNGMSYRVPFLIDWTWADALSGVTTFVAVLGILGRLVLQGEPAP